MPCFRGRYDDNGMLRNVLKFGVGGLALVAVAVGVLFLVDYLRYRTSPEYRAEQELKELERRYAEDTYGGSTPEETLQLFIDALKRGDVELASKLFALEEQEKWNQELSRIKQRGSLQLMIEDLLKATKSKQEEDQVFFTVTNDKNVVTVLIDIRKNIGGKWKIIDL